MNRLILVGNGFDLAHGLKTSYCDFISDYISYAINMFYRNLFFEDLLVKIKWNNNARVIYDIWSTPQTALEDLEGLQSIDDISVNIKSDFLLKTLTKISKINWVDLENDYFDHLLSYKTHEFNFTQVKKLNDELDFIKTQLESYLLSHHKQSNITYHKKFTELFCEPIKGDDIVTIKTKDIDPKTILILSFNYTNTLEKYAEACAERGWSGINYIHGELDSSTNPIIFGFGDEYNKSYLEFEELKNKELLKHIKSFGYFRTSNYHDLMRFIDEDDFQVYIFGHSLGLSDRTMLKQIFEHKQCKSIKIFYHQKPDGTNDYTDKTFDISSHFSDKGMMRKKIVPFSLSQPMPQIDDM